MDYEFPRERVRMVKVLGSGNFGEVWLAQAYQIKLLDPRNKSEDAKKQREKIRTSKKAEKEMDKEIREGGSLELVAIKKIKGELLNQNDFSLSLGSQFCLSSSFSW